MQFEKTKIDGVFIVTPNVFGDDRGYFASVFRSYELEEQSIQFPIIEINRSLTRQKATIRGLHYQTGEKAQDKLVSCLQGSIFDVAVDLREGSQTFGQWVGQILNAEDKKMLLVPKGFAHGFQALEEDCLVQYYVTARYAPEAERGVRWNDKKFGVEWPIQESVITSEKDAAWPLFD